MQRHVTAFAPLGQFKEIWTKNYAANRQIKLKHFIALLFLVFCGVCISNAIFLLKKKN